MKFCRLCHKTLPNTAFSLVDAHNRQVCDICLRAESVAKYKRMKAENPLEFWAKTIVRKIRSRCKKAGRLFALEAQWLIQMWEKQAGRCYYCNRKMELLKTQGDDLGVESSRPGIIQAQSVSVDRVVNTKGYTEDNVVLACAQCNKLKSSASHEELQQLANGVTRFLSGNR